MAVTQQKKRNYHIRHCCFPTQRCMQGKIHYDTTLPMDSSLKMSLRAHALQSIRASAAAGEAGTGLGEDEYDAVRRCASKLDPGLKAPPSF